MGMNTDSGGSGNTVFLSAINVGDEVFWARRVSAETEGAVKRINKNNDTVHELYYPSITGRIEAVRIVDKGQYGEELEVRVRDDDPDSDLVMLLQMTYTSDLGKHFICRMEEMDENVDITIGVFRKLENGKDYRTTWAKQGDVKVENLYTKSGPKDLPKPVITEGRRGKKEYDFREQENYLFDLAEEMAIKKGWAEDSEEFIVSTFKRGETTEHQDEPEPAAPETPAVDDDDDVPF
jgi:hypothetical protein